MTLLGLACLRGHLGQIHSEQVVNVCPTLPPVTLTNSFKSAPSRNRNVSRPVSRVLSRRFPAMDDHSSGAAVAGGFARPTRAVGRKSPEPKLVPPLFGLALPQPLPATRCALTAPFHPCCGQVRERFNFCGTFPGVAPAGCYPAPYFRGARTFLPRTLSGLAGAAIQPTDAPDLFRPVPKVNKNRVFANSVGKAIPTAANPR
jgi:hypothetical protein